MHLHRASSCGAAARVNGAIIAAGGSLEVGKPQDHLAVFDVVLLTRHSCCFASSQRAGNWVREAERKRRREGRKVEGCQVSDHKAALDGQQ